MEEHNRKIIQIEQRNLLDYEDIKPYLNIARSIDLERVLRLTPVRYRIETALAFSGLSQKDWFIKAGVIQDWNIEKYYVKRWLEKTTRLPLGIALRLSKVLSISCEILFADFIK